MSVVDPRVYFGSATKNWYEAGTVTTVSSATSSWTDRIGSEPLLQATAGQRPPWNASDAGWNGGPTVQFSAASAHQLVTAGNISLSSFAITLVGETTNESQYAMLYSMGDGNSSTQYLFAHTNTGAGAFGHVAGPTGLGSIWQFKEATTVSKFVITQVCGTTHQSHRFFYNGMLLPGNPYTSAGYTTDPGATARSNQLYLGAFYSPAYSLTGKFTDIAICDSVPDSQAIVNYQVALMRARGILAPSLKRPRSLLGMGL